MLGTKVCFLKEKTSTDNKNAYYRVIYTLQIFVSADLVSAMYKSIVVTTVKL